MAPQPRTGYLLAILAALAWAGTSPGLGYLLNTYAIPPLTLALWRDGFIALVCGAALLLLRPQWLRLSAREWRGFALAGMVSVGIYHALFVWSIALNGAAMGIVLIYTYPAFVTLGSRLVFGEPISVRQLIGLLLALTGCVLVVGAYNPAVWQTTWLGLLVGLGSAATHAVYVLFNQRSIAKHSPWVGLTLTMVFGTLTLLVLTLVFNGPAGVIAVEPSPWPWLLMLAIALGPTLGGYALFTSSLRYIPGWAASLIVVLEIPTATLLAVALLGERLAWPQILGMLLILTAAILPGLPLRRKPAAQPQLQPAEAP